MKREEILARIAKLDEEIKKRRGDGALAGYNSGKKKHKKQLKFHRCKKRNRWVFGGNRSGKTECGAVECIWMLRGIHPYRKNRANVFGWAVSLSQQVQRDVAQAKILKYLPESWIESATMLSGRRDSLASGIIDQIRIKNVFGGISVLGFKSCDQGREKFQGSSLDFVWFDEEPPRDIYEECLMRVLDKKGEVFGTMTPLKGRTFIYDEIYLNRRCNPEVWSISMSWSDNPYLDKKETALLESCLGGSTLDARKFGRFSDGGGLVYPEFDESIHVIPPFDVPKEWQDNISIDPGFTNPLSAHWYAVDYDGNVYVVAEHFAAGRDIDYHAAKILEISRRIGWRADGRGRVRALIDSAANQHTLASAKSVAEMLCERGVVVNTRVDKNVLAGIMRVKSYLAGEGARLYIFNTCKNLIEEFGEYFWGEGDAPVKRDDHCMDELRYYLSSRPKPPKRECSPLVEAKLKRIKKRRTGSID